MFARLCLVFLLLFAALWIGRADQAPRESVNSRAAVPRFQQNPQNNTSINPRAIDLSGTYIGVLEYPAAGLSGVALLTIAGNKFTLTIESTTLSGLINVLSARDYTKVSMLFEPRSDGSPSAPISLSASKSGDHLRLASLPDEKTYFRFGDQNSHARHMRKARRGPASVDGNSSSNTTATNGNMNTTNGNINTNRGLPRNGNSRPESRPTPTSRRSPDREVRPTHSPRATSADNSNTNANSNSNTSFSSQIRGNANVAFTTPDSMKLEETKDIELLVSPTESVETLVNNLGEPGRAGTGTTKFADRMEAKLVSTGFNITAASPEIQPVEPGQNTRWIWQIKPKEGGPQRLDLTLSAVINDGKDRKLITTFKRDIRINVSLGHRASTFIAGLKDAQWLWVAIILPLGGAIYGWWHKKRKRGRRKK